MSRIAQQAEALALPVAESLGVQIWDVEYVKEAGQWFLRVYIDREGGVDINACESFSRAFEPVLDEADPIEGSYVFEVSSPGADRELKKPEHFAKYLGERVDVKLYRPRDGAKAWSGTLSGYDDGAVTIEAASGTVRFEKSEVAQVRLSLDF
ncbi:MAG: ribosome maturation factor RimP [Oscillospiraceae bacterium]|nr:ribosome maturation factor RimP [Oscillospiraceae bacterium]